MAHTKIKTANAARATLQALMSRIQGGGEEVKQETETETTFYMEFYTRDVLCQAAGKRTFNFHTGFFNECTVTLATQNAQAKKIQSASWSFRLAMRAKRKKLEAERAE